MVNNDVNDNRFLEPVGRFPKLRNEPAHITLHRISRTEVIYPLVVEAFLPGMLGNEVMEPSSC